MRRRSDSKATAHRTCRRRTNDRHCPPSAHRRGRRGRRGGARRHGSCPGWLASEPDRPHRRSRCARRNHRHHGAAARRAPAAALGPERGGGEQVGRRRHHRHHGGGARPAGRPHHPAGQHRPAGGRLFPVPQPAIRSREPAAGLEHDPGAERAGAAPVGAGELGPGTRRPSARQSRQARLRQSRRRPVAAPLGGVVRPAHRHRVRPRALPRRRARHGRARWRATSSSCSTT